MQDCFEILKRFIPTYRLSKFLCCYRYYARKILRVYILLFNEGYKYIVEAVNCEQMWELFPNVPPHLLYKLKPRTNVSKFLYFAGKYIPPKIAPYLLWGAIEENDYKSFHTALKHITQKCTPLPGGRAILESPLLPLAYNALQRYPLFKQALMDIYGIYQQKYPKLLHIFAPDLSEFAIAWHRTFSLSVLKKLYLCGGAKIMEDIFDHYNTGQINIIGDIFSLSKSEVLFFLKFRKKFAIRTRMCLTLLTLPQKNIKDYICAHWKNVDYSFKTMFINCDYICEMPRDRVIFLIKRALRKHKKAGIFSGENLKDKYKYIYSSIRKYNGVNLFIQNSYERYFKDKFLEDIGDYALLGVGKIAILNAEKINRVDLRFPDTQYCNIQFIKNVIEFAFKNPCEDILEFIERLAKYSKLNNIPYMQKITYQWRHKISNFYITKDI